MLCAGQTLYQLQQASRRVHAAKHKPLLTLQPYDIAEADPTPCCHSNHFEVLGQCLRGELLLLVDQPLQLLPRGEQLRLQLQVAGVGLLQVLVLSP